MKKKLSKNDWQEKASKYIIEEYSRYSREVSIEKRDDNSWCVSCDGNVLSKTKGCFVREPSPSNRTDEFLKDTRFETKEVAYSVYCELCENSPF